MVGSIRVGPIAWGAVRRFVLCVALAVGSSCGPDGGPVGFDDFFEQVRRVEFEEPADNPIVGISALSERPGGGYVLTDGASARVHLYDPSGRLERSLGRRGTGPGELDGPTAAVETGDGSVLVTQGGDPRLTVFHPDGEGEPIIARVPGFYGTWLAPLGDSAVVVRVGTREERLAVLSLDGQVRARFALLDPVVNATPYWIYFARQHSAVLRGNVVTNTSFFPTLTVFGPAGDSLAVLGAAPPSWIDPTAPPIDRIEQPGDRDRLEEWARSFTVVRHVAVVADSVIVVQYGRHLSRSSDDPYYATPTTLDAYAPDGTKLLEDVAFDGPIIGGAGELWC